MGSSLKIAYLYQTPCPQLDGNRAAPLHIYHVIKHLQGRGHNVRLLTLQGRYPAYAEDINAVRAGRADAFQCANLGFSGTALFLLGESGVRRIQRELGLPYLGLFDSLHFYEACCRELRGCAILHERYNTLSIGGSWAAQRLGIPLVLEVNGDLIAEGDYRGVSLRGLQRQIAIWHTHTAFAIARAIVCPSKGLGNHLIARWNVPQEKVHLVPNAADVETFGSIGDTAPWRERLNLPESALVVMFVGGFYHWHGLEFLIEAFAQVRSRIPAAHLVLVGDGEARRSVESCVARLSLDGAVILAGDVLHDQVPTLVALADVVVAPWRRFCWGLAPLKLFEYMAAGKAIVASSVEGIDEFVEDGETGVLVAPEDSDALALALTNLLIDSDERVRLGCNARRQAWERHSWQHHVERLEKIYASVLA